ncbi:MAG: ABC transporter permease, partial [Candidatus Thorarchaeota archaeon]
MLKWQLKTAIHSNQSNKFRFIIAILVIGISISLIITVNGLVDNIAANYSETAFTDQSNADISVLKADNSIIYNVSTLTNAFDNSSLKGITKRIIVNAAIKFNNPFGGIGSFPTQIIGINFSQENKIGLGTFDPNYSSLGLNKTLVFGNFGKQIEKALGSNISLSLTLPTENAKIIPINLTIADVVNQSKKFATNMQNVFIVDLDTLYQFINPDSATNILGVFIDHDSVYSINNIDNSLKTVRDRAIIIQKSLGFNYIVNLPLAQAFENAQTGLDSQRIFLNFISIIVAIVSGVLIFGLNNTAIEEKSYEFAVYRSLGLKNYHILIQAFLVSLIKGFLGLIIGIIFGYFLTAYLTSNSYLAVPISITTYSIAIILGGLLILFSTLYPVIQSTKKQILVALDISKAESSAFQSRISSQRNKIINLKTILYGVAFSSLGVIIFAIFPFVTYVYGQQVLNSFVLLILILVLLGFILITIGMIGPLFTQGILLFFNKIFYKSSFGVKMFLRKNSRRNYITSIVFAITLAFVFFVATLQFTTLNTVIYGLKSNTGSDLVIFPRDSTNKELNNKIFNATRSNVLLKSSYTTLGSIFTITGCTITAGDELFFNSYSPSVYGVEKNFLNAIFSNYELTPGSNFSLVQNNDTVAISNSLAKKLDLSIGDQMRIKISSPIKENNIKYGKNVHLTVVAILNRLPGFPDITIDENRAYFSPLFVGLDTWTSFIKPNNETEYNSTLTSENFIRQFYVKGFYKDIQNFEISLFLEFGTEIFIIDYNLFVTLIQQRIEASINS